MTIQVLIDTLLGLALVTWICYRQLTWRPADIDRMMRLPIILGGVGLVTLATATKPHVLTATDIALVLIEAAFAFGIGALMGRLAGFRPMGPDRAQQYVQRRGRRSGGPMSRGGLGRTVDHETRTGWLGLLLWVALIGVRVGIDALAQSLGSTLLTSTGIILVMIAVNRVARATVLSHRLGRLPKLPTAPAVTGA